MDADPPVSEATTVAEAVAALRARTGLDVVGAYAFGDSPALQDELLEFVRRGTKRATVGPVDQPEEDGEPPVEVGQCWGVLDGRGQPHFVIETVEVIRGRVGDVTPAFAWDEGEYDRTLESWLDGHRRYFRRAGAADPDAVEVFFERFRVVWPVADEPVAIAAGVRELRWDERGWLAALWRQRRGTAQAATRGGLLDVTALPALVAERDGQRVDVLVFRPHPTGEAECIGFDPVRGAAGAELMAGIAALGRRHGWSRVWLDADVISGEEARAHQRLGWTPVERSAGPAPAAGGGGPAAVAAVDEGTGRPGLELEIRLG